MENWQILLLQSVKWTSQDYLRTENKRSWKIIKIPTGCNARPARNFLIISCSELKSRLTWVQRVNFSQDYHNANQSSSLMKSTYAIDSFKILWDELKPRAMLMSKKCHSIYKNKIHSPAQYMSGTSYQGQAYQL